MSLSTPSPAGAALALRDIHQPPAPAWWPPAPGWWWLAAGVLSLVLAVLFFYWRRRRHLAAMAHWFDGTVDAASTPEARIAAISQLLRRAARTIDPAADALAGEEWLRFLDRGLDKPVFAEGDGALLRDGAFRRDLSAREVDVVRRHARARFLDWMSKR